MSGMGTKDSFYCFDVNQEPPFGTVSEVVPCLVSHGKIAHGPLQKVATGLEHLVIIGAADVA